MDRSSMRVVQTDDFEKRLSFKERLASKFTVKEEPKEIVDTSNGFIVGDRVSHPNFGVGTVVSIDTKANEIVLDFNAGTIPMVLSQVKSLLARYEEAVVKSEKWNDAVIGDKIQRDNTLHRPDVAFRSVVEQPIREEAEPKPIEFVPVEEPKRDVFEGAFIGDEIDRTPAHRPDIAYRHVEIDKERPIVKEAVLPSASLSVGKQVWHPELGNCTILSVNRDYNEIVLLSEAYDRTSLVLSAVQSKLKFIENAPEAVPLKPLKREELRPAPKAPAPRDVKVVIPPVFNTWSFANKYHFLAYNQRLTTAEANDVFLVLDGKTPQLHKVEIAWEDPIIVEPVEVEAGHKETKVEVHPWTLKRVWHPDFGACIVHSVEDDVLILESSVGHVPFVLSAVLPRLISIDDNFDIEHAQKRLGTKEAMVEEPEVKLDIIQVELPEVFKTWRQVQQYQYLQSNQKLGPDEANDVLTILNGGTAKAGRNFDIYWIEKEAFETTLSVKEDLLYKGQVPQKPSYGHLLGKKVQFANVGESYVSYINEKNNLIVLSIKGENVPISLNMAVNNINVLSDEYYAEYVLENYGSEPVAEKAKAESVIVTVVLPKAFNTWRTSDQYIFLTSTKKFTPERANDIIAIMSGSNSHSFKGVEYSIEVE